MVGSQHMTTPPGAWDMSSNQAQHIGQGSNGACGSDANAMYWRSVDQGMSCGMSAGVTFPPPGPSMQQMPWHGQGPEQARHEQIQQSQGSWQGGIQQGNLFPEQHPRAAGPTGFCAMGLGGFDGRSSGPSLSGGESQAGPTGVAKHALLVQQVKALQRSSEDLKAAWHHACDP